MLTRLLTRFLNYGQKREYKRDVCPPSHRMIRDIAYKNDQNPEHTLDIIYPELSSETATSNNYPWILLIHGGGFCMNSKEELYHNYALRLAGAEYVVVSMNYRLAPASRYPAQIQDVLSALAFLNHHAKEYALNLDQMYLTGDSAGAYLACMAACVLTNQELKEYYQFQESMTCRAVASNCGMFDFTTYLQKDVHFPARKLVNKSLFGSDHYQSNPAFAYSSVYSYITKQFPPCYLMDTEGMSFAAEGKRMKQHLDAKAVPNQFHLYPKSAHLMHAFHIMSRFPQSSEVIEEMLQFFRQHA